MKICFALKLDSPGSRLIFSTVDRCGIVTPLGWCNKPNPWAWALYLLGWLEGQPPHGSRGQWGFDGDRRLRPRSCPLQALDDRAAHHTVLVSFGEETQLFGEMADAAAVASLGVAIGQVGTPIAALRAARFARVGCSFRFRTQTRPSAAGRCDGRRWPKAAGRPHLLLRGVSWGKRTGMR